MSKSWLWPDREISPLLSGALREEHNALVNSHAEILDELKRSVQYINQLADLCNGYSKGKVRASDFTERAEAAIAKAQEVNNG